MMMLVLVAAGAAFIMRVVMLVAAIVLQRVVMLAAARTFLIINFSMHFYSSFQFYICFGAETPKSESARASTVRVASHKARRAA